ncbi:MAG: hypothetical protein R3F34_08895 [Planctomycetota bacterium]
MLLAIAALSSDLGLIRTTQVTMQNSVDSAALEGVRWVDELNDDLRRVRAKEAMRLTFDEDLDLTTTPNVEFAFGAGPQASYLALGVVEAAGGLVPGSLGLYQPDPQPNSINREFGDLVAGTFVASESNPVDNVENFDYSRPDFEVADQAGAGDAKSFLVRLRRTPNLFGFDAVPDVSSTGGGVPIFFGLGPLSLANTGQEFDVRRDGVAVRATALAQGRPIVSVGAKCYDTTQAPSLDALGEEGFLVVGRQTTGEYSSTGCERAS